jgi:hypothetical protein
MVRVVDIPGIEQVRATIPKFNGLYHDFHTHARSPGDPGLWVLATRHFGSWAAELPAAPLRWAG